jgi:hypothetical protein
VPTYRTGFTSVAAAPGAPYFTFHTTTRQARIIQVSYFSELALAAPIGIVYPNNVPVATTTTNPVADDLEDAPATCGADTAWSTPPTIAGTPDWSDQIWLGPAVGAGVVIPIVPPTLIAKASYLAWWNFSGFPGPNLAVQIVYEE